jgi:hypothetical protein
MGTREHLDRFCELAVGRDRAVLVSVGTREIGEHERVARVALGARHRMSIAIAADRQRLIAYT